MDLLKGQCLDCHLPIYRRTVKRMEPRPPINVLQYELDGEAMPLPPRIIEAYEYSTSPMGTSIRFCPNCGTML